MAKKLYDYKGGGNLPGIPARDIDEDDWAALDADQKKLVRDNAKHGDHDETKHAAIYAAVEAKPEPPATTKGG